MIIYPSNWQTIGQPIDLREIEDAISQSIEGIDCNCLSFSGGVDSTLLLYFMLKLERKVRTFTVACNSGHPDLNYASHVLKYMERKFQCKIESNFIVFTNGIYGDEAVKAYYWNIGYTKGVDSIIAGDGIDEFMAGYYKHMEQPTEYVYYDYLRRLLPEHLIPLNDNSGKVKVFLPYIDKRVIYLLSQIPLSEKVNHNERKRIILALAEGKMPNCVLERRKYGFCTKSNER